MLDPNMAARIDVAAYKQGGKDLTNVLGLPHGGVSIRPGLSYLAEIPAANDGARLIRFEFSTDQVYLLVLRAEAIDVYMPDGSKKATVQTTYTADQVPSVAWTQSLDTLILVHPNHPPAKLMRQGSHEAWALSDIALQNIPTYDFDGDGDGTGTTPPEPVWSATRGWPRSVFLHEGRLYFGGSKSRPQTIWGSRSGKFFDFETTTDALDDEAVEMTLDNDRVCAVQQLYSLSGFFAFTSGGLFARTSDTIITPSAFMLRRSSEVPASAARPAELDGSVLFIKDSDNGHSSVYELSYNYEIESYKAEDIALLAGSLMRKPVEMAARLGNEQDSANHLYVVNGADGTVAVLNSRKSQNMTGWTLLVTDGQVLRVAVVGGVPYFLVRRNIAGVDRLFLEYLNFSGALDCGSAQSSEFEKDTWSGFAWLDGATVDMIGDGSPIGQTIVTNGEVVTPYPVKKLEVGFAFDWAVETMPVDTGTQDGMATGGRHRITKAAIRMHDTAGVTVNGRLLVKSKLGQDLLDKPAQRFTGMRNVRFLGWSGGRVGEEGATVRIVGDSTNPATILSVATEVAQ
jgi:hypothetical protein